MLHFVRLFAVLLAFETLALSASKDLQIYFIDVEGGQATLFITPSGESLLVDTGWGYNAYRDANRIASVAKRAKVKRLNAVLITHYHTDHVGGVPQLMSKIPVDAFYDHGPNRESSNATEHLFRDYQDATANSNRVTVRPGSSIPLKGTTIQVIAADGAVSHKGANANSACANAIAKDADPSENARSVGVILRFGEYSLVDLGDLTWNKELELVCPTSPFTRTSVFVVSHHGLDQSNSPALLNAIRPQVAVFDNGSKKGASPAAWDIVHSSPGLQDIWQLHFADAGGQEHNAADPYIANVDEADAGFWLKIVAHEDGSFIVENQRNHFSKTYSR